MFLVASSHYGVAEGREAADTRPKLCDKIIDQKMMCLIVYMSVRRCAVAYYSIVK